MTGLVLAALLLGVGCGDDGLSASRRSQLAARVDQARAAAGKRDADGVRRALAAFRATVRVARDRGDISAEDADRLLAGALQASRRARQEITPQPAPTPAATATVAPAPAPAAPAKPEKPKGHGNSKGGKGKGKGKGDD